jgi:nitroreductase
MTNTPVPDIDLFEAIDTMRAIRRFKADPVPDALLRRVLEAAGQAPSGGNRQPWRWVVIRSAKGKRKVSELVQAAVERAAAARSAGQDRRPAPAPTATGGDDFAASLAHAPVLIIACAQRPVSEGPWSVGPFGQSYPAVENLLLAARGVGLGGTITTSFRWMEAEFRDLLGLPNNIDPTCLIPLGYPAGTDGQHHGPKSRKPIEEMVCEEHWDQAISF